MADKLPYTRLEAGEAHVDPKCDSTSVSRPRRWHQQTGTAKTLKAIARAVGTSLLVVAGYHILWIVLLVTPSKTWLSATTRSTAVPSPVAEAAWNRSLAQCRDAWGPLPGPSKEFDSRTKSDRFVEGTKDVVVRNATIWTGNDDGREIVKGDVWLSGGIIKAVGYLDDIEPLKYAEVVHANGAWLTPGIFDMHSHIGDFALPSLSGAADTNSVQKPILPYLRSLDAFNTHDTMFSRVRSGGVTTALVLPGSANNIGGQAFLFKLRDTKEKTPASMMLEPPFNLPFAAADRKVGDPPRWRHMKNACGENIRRVYHQTRMDLAWNFRTAFNEARSVKQAQDRYCEKAFEAERGGKFLNEAFPENLEWEALVDVLRGKVKVNTHCYESTDLQAYVDHTLEFEYPLAAFHHAHEAYLVPDLLNKTYGGPPAAAIFATNGRYKRESWRGSEYAPLVLSQNGIRVVMKSDHPVLNSQYLIFEAQQAHHFGLPENLALASLFSTPAEVQGIDHRIGFIRTGHDADLVLWDSHPLTLGSTPTQVFIDGIPQLSDPFVVSKPDLQSAPQIPPVVLPDTLDEPPVPQDVVGDALFTNISTVYGRAGDGIKVVATTESGSALSVGISNGSIACIGDCTAFVTASSQLSTTNLNGGTIAPGFIGFGPALGLVDIISEKSTQDGRVFDPLEVEGKLGELEQTPVRAVDGLQLDGKHLRYANRFGVTKAVTAPQGNGVFRGVSVAFRTGAKNALEEGAILRTDAALHLTIGHDSSAPPSISTQIGVLRRLLLGSVSLESLTKAFNGPESAHDEPDYFALAAYGALPLVVNVWKADHMATLIHLKDEVESSVSTLLASSPLAGKVQPAKIRLVFHGGQESHLIAKEIADAGVGVIVSPPRPLPESWDERRAPPSIPLAEAPLPVLLERAGVKVGLGVPEEWTIIQVGWEAGWAVRDSSAKRANVTAEAPAPLGKETGIKWLTTNLEELLGIPSEDGLRVGAPAEFVAWRGDPLDFGSQVVGIVQSGQVKLF